MSIKSSADGVPVITSGMGILKLYTDTQDETADSKTKKQRRHLLYEYVRYEASNAELHLLNKLQLEGRPDLKALSQLVKEKLGILNPMPVGRNRTTTPGRMTMMT